MIRPLPISITLKLILTTLFWGGTFVAGRIAVQTLGPFTAAFWRYVLAGGLLLILLYSRSQSAPVLSRRQWGQVTLLALTGIFAYNLFFFSGLQRIEAGRAALLIALNPTLTAVAAAWLFHERLAASRWLGVALALLGEAVVVSRGNLDSLWQGAIGSGELLMLGGVLSWVAYTLVGKTALEQLSPLVSTTWAALIGAGLLLVPALAEGLPAQTLHASAAAWGAVLFLALFGTVIGFVWFFDGVQAVGAAKAASFINLVPLFGVLLGTLLLHETLPPSVLAGGLLVIIGVYLINRPRNHALSSLAGGSRLGEGG